MEYFSYAMTQDTQRRNLGQLEKKFMSVSDVIGRLFAYPWKSREGYSDDTKTLSSNLFVNIICASSQVEASLQAWAHRSRPSKFLLTSFSQAFD